MMKTDHWRSTFRFPLASIFFAGHKTPERLVSKAGLREGKGEGGQERNLKHFNQGATLGHFLWRYVEKLRCGLVADQVCTHSTHTTEPHLVSDTPLWGRDSLEAEVS